MSEEKKNECKDCGLDHSGEPSFSAEQMVKVADVVYSTVKMIAAGVEMGPAAMATILSVVTARICDVNDIDRIKLIRVMLETPGKGHCALDLHEVKVKTDEENSDDPANAPN